MLALCVVSTQPFFKFVFHSVAAVMVAPLAIRLGHRPLLCFLVQGVVNALMKPFPSVTDIAQYMVGTLLCGGAHAVLWGMLCLPPARWPCNFDALKEVC